MKGVTGFEWVEGNYLYRGSETEGILAYTNEISGWKNQSDSLLVLTSSGALDLLQFSTSAHT